MIIIIFIASKWSLSVPCSVYIYTQTYTCVCMCEDLQILFFGLPKNYDYKETADRELNCLEQWKDLPLIAWWVSGRAGSGAWLPIQSTFADPCSLFLFYYYFLSLCFHSLKDVWLNFLRVVSKLQKESKQVKAAATIEQQA